MTLLVGSLFSGVGGFELGFDNSGGYDLAFQVEIDKACNKVLRHHWPDAQRYEDVKEVTRERLYHDLGPRAAIDVAVGGFPCFPAGTLVLTPWGHVPIEEIQVGDRVLTHRGRWQPVERVGHRLAPTILLKGHGQPCLVTTAEHPILSCQRTRAGFGEPTWAQAKDMKGRHWASARVFPVGEVPPFDEVGREYLPVESVTPGFMWVLGAWLGDGWAHADPRRGRVTICEAHGEHAVADRLREIGLHFTTAIEPTTDNRIISNRCLARWLERHFGSGAACKAVPAWLLGLDEQSRRAFLDGYLHADGTVEPSGRFRSTSVSKNLSLGIKLLAQTLGYAVALYRHERPKVSVIEGRTVSQRPVWTVVGQVRYRSAGVVGEHIYGCVRLVTPTGQTEEVYNISVGTDESFLADGIIVHNCTDVSVAGARAGLAGSASGLFFEFARLIDELSPTWVVIENVPGLLSSQKGRDMGTVLGTLAELGYGFAYRVLDARFFGVPQRRRRVVIVGHLGTPWSASAEVLFEPESCGGAPASSKPSAEDDADPVEAGTRESRRVRPGRRPKRDVEHHTLTASLLAGGGPELKHAEAGVLIPEVAGTLGGGGNSRRGFCDDFDRSGAFIPVERERLFVGSEWKDESARTLCGVANGPRYDFDTENWVVEEAEQQAYSIYPESGQGADLVAREVDTAPALTATGIAQVTDRGTFVAEAFDAAIPVDLRNATRTDTRSGAGTAASGFGTNGDPSYTVTAELMPAVATFRKAARAHTSTGVETWKETDEANCLNGYEYSDVRTTHAVVEETTWTVRRLTPLECERLQGWPDRHTAVGLDENGSEVQIPDSSRYKQAGNGVASPVAEWVAARLIDVHTRLHPLRSEPK